MHTAGEPLRVVIDGFPEIPGNSILDKRKYVRDHYDDVRTALILEPRGHADMYGCILTEPTTEEADFGVIFMHNEGYSTMCGHAIIGITKLAVELGWIPQKAPVTELNIEAPCGIIKCKATIRNGQVAEVEFENVPSFVFSTNNKVELPEFGNVTYDVAYGGAFYAFVDASSLGISCVPEDYRELTQAGLEIKQAVMNKDKIIHPFEDELSFLYGTIFIRDPVSPEADSRNVCVFADGELDRSPTGSGVSARLALHYAKNEIKPGETIIIESILGTKFKGRIKEVCQYAGYPAVVPVVSGEAYITGAHTFYIDPDDPLKEGFILR